jgi:hypothetical protein
MPFTIKKRYLRIIDDNDVYDNSHDWLCYRFDHHISNRIRIPTTLLIFSREAYRECGQMFLQTLRDWYDIELTRGMTITLTENAVVLRINPVSFN